MSFGTIEETADDKALRELSNAMERLQKETEQSGKIMSGLTLILLFTCIVQLVAIIIR